MTDSAGGREDRYHSENEGLFRQASRRDRDRLTYSREFRRLKGVTQVARAGESYLYHDRLSHSLKVAQVGGSLARIFLKRVDSGNTNIDSCDQVALDPYVVEAASYAHDLGHPPFGHAIEDELDTILTERTEDWHRTIGYEGNAQAFRIVTNLASHDQPSGGLNLTRATLNAMQKYPWSRDENDHKWGYYPAESDIFDFARGETSDDRDPSQVLETQIMDYADDLTYAVHDVDDFYRAGLIPLDQLFREATDRVSSRDELDAFEEYLDDESDIDPNRIDIADLFRNLSDGFHGFDEQLFTPFKGTDSERVALNSYDSALISWYIEASRPQAQHVRLEESKYDTKVNLDVDEGYRTQIEVLKLLTEYYVITNPSLMAQQKGLRRIARELFKSLYNEAGPDSMPRSAVPSPYRERLKTVHANQGPPSSERIIADMIAAMTEQQAVALHKRMIGDTPGPLVDEILR